MLPKGSAKKAIVFLSAGVLWALVFNCSRKNAPAGSSCRHNEDCRPGLRCSAQKKCYRPVDCRRLKTRLTACSLELLEAMVPQVRSLTPTRRRKVKERLEAASKSKVVNHCRYDSGRYFRVHRSAPPVRRSRGQDRDARAWTKCLGHDACSAFARCALRLAGLTPRPAAR